jgi:predicted amidohydrolase
MRVAVCQTPDIRQDPDAALAWIETYGEKAGAQAASLLCFPECFFQGFPTSVITLKAVSWRKFHCLKLAWL